MMNFTHSDFQKLNDNEKKLSQELNTDDNGKVTMPDQNVVNNILAYSKALSVRKSETVGFVENVLN